MIFTSSPTVKFEIIHRMIERDNNLLNITWLCEIAGVSWCGYYKWLKSKDNRTQRECNDKADFELIQEAYAYKGYDKGVEGIHMRLLRLKVSVIMNPKKIRRLMHKYDLQCPIRKANSYRKMARAKHEAKIAPNLLNREFKTYGERMVLLTDITYIPRFDSEFSYLSVIMDAYTKEILAHVCSRSLEVDFVLQTIEILMSKHGAELKTDVLIHSDQGTHYTSYSSVDILSDKELRQSMSRRGNCWDNAPQECLFGHMKDEIHIYSSDRHIDVKRKIDDWVDYYNNERGQWDLQKPAPTEYFQFITTGVYPLPIPIPKKPNTRVRKKKKHLHNRKHRLIRSGALPPNPPPEFIALSLQNDDKISNEKGDDFSPPITS